MNVLFIRANCEHVNEMHINNIRGFMRVADITFYGPGYTTDEILDKGISWFWKDRGGFDVVIIDYFMLMLQKKYLDLPLAYHWHRYYLSDFYIHYAIRYADKIVEEILSLDTVKIVQYMYDTDRFPKEWENVITELLNEGFYFWGNGKEFFPYFPEDEIYVQAGFSNNYRRFCEKNKTRIISMTYSCADYSEFYGRPLKERKYDVTVPGNLDTLTYPLRSLILEVIKESNFMVYDKYPNRVLGYRRTEDRWNSTEYKRFYDEFLDREMDNRCIYMDTKLSRKAHSAWTGDYSTGLRESKIAYADGGFDLQLVRKHFEICARGTLMICQNSDVLNQVGFRDGYNMIEVDETDVVEKCNHLLGDIKVAQTIARRGQEFVFRRHSPEVHARMIIESIDRIKNNDYYGSEWKDGSYIIHTHDRDLEF